MATTTTATTTTQAHTVVDARMSTSWDGFAVLGESSRHNESHAARDTPPVALSLVMPVNHPPSPRSTSPYTYPESYQYPSQATPKAKKHFDSPTTPRASNSASASTSTFTDSASTSSSFSAAGQAGYATAKTPLPIRGPVPSSTSSSSSVSTLTHSGPSGSRHRSRPSLSRKRLSSVLDYLPFASSAKSVFHRRLPPRSPTQGRQKQAQRHALSLGRSPFDHPVSRRRRSSLEHLKAWRPNSAWSLLVNIVFWLSVVVYVAALLGYGVSMSPGTDLGLVGLTGRGQTLRALHQQREAEGDGGSSRTQPQSEGEHKSTWHEIEREREQVKADAYAHEEFDRRASVLRGGKAEVVRGGGKAEAVREAGRLLRDAVKDRLKVRWGEHGRALDGTKEVRARRGQARKGSVLLG
jgi:hypothetical protein